MGKTQSDFVSRKLIVENVILGPRKSFNKDGKKVPREKVLRELKFNYDPEFWSDIKPPSLADPLEAIQAELGRYRNLHEQYQSNQKKKLN